MKLEKFSHIIKRFKDLTTLGVANVSATAIGGIFWFIVASLVGESHYGQISYIIAIAGIAGVLSMLGSGSTIIVYTAKGEKILAHLSLWIISSSIVASIVIFFLVHDIGATLYVIGYAIFTLAISELLGKKLYQDYSKYIITQRILMAGLGIAFYYILGYQGIILGISLSFFPYLLRLYNVLRESKIDFSVLRSKRDFMVNSYALDLSRTFSTSIDKLIIVPLFGFAVLGNYQLGIQFFTLLTLIPSAAYQYILPQDAAGDSNKKLKKILVVSSILIAFLGIALSPIVLPEFFPKFSKATQVTEIISVGVIPFTINTIFISKFLGSLKNRIVVIGSLIYLVAMVSGIVFLGQPFGIKGVAGGYVLGITAEAVYLIIVNKLINKSTGIDTEHEKPLKIGLDFFIKNPWITLLIIGVTTILLRLYFLPKSIPLTLDALQYFWYANDISILHHFPSWAIDHNGWPAFLSIFFSVFHSHSFLDYMNLQRIVTVAISTLTIIPVYLLCKRFVSIPYALLGATIFAFEPRIIQNSLLGITDPLYIFLVTFSIVLFLSSEKRFLFGSFALASLATLVRTEGLVLFLVLSIMFFVRHRKEGKVIAKYALAALIFVLVLLPMIEVRIQTSGHDFITSRITGEIGSLSPSEKNSKSNILSNSIKTLENPIKFLGWSMIPIFIFFVPVGAYLIFKNRNHDTWTIIIAIIVMGMLAFYALAKFPDTRYLYPLYPLFCVLSILSAKFYANKFHNQKMFLIFLLGGILLATGTFLALKNPVNIEQEKEALSIAQLVSNETVVIDLHNTVAKYVPVVEMEQQKFPTLSDSIVHKTKFFPTLGFNSMEEYITFAKENEVKWMVLDGSNRDVVLNDVFYHEEKYPYLIKIYDSLDHGYKYHLKIYKINYDAFNSLLKIYIKDTSG